MAVAKSSATAKVTLAMRVCLTIFLVVLSCVLLRSDNAELRSVGAGIIGGLIGYWFK
jgi:hypothetical protein